MEKYTFYHFFQTISRQQITVNLSLPLFPFLPFTVTTFLLISHSPRLPFPVSCLSFSPSFLPSLTLFNLARPLCAFPHFPSNSPFMSLIILFPFPSISFSSNSIPFLIPVQISFPYCFRVPFRL